MIIALLGALAGLFWAMSSLQRSGLDFNSLNPFLMYRRWQWKKIYGVKPLYNLESTMEVAAVLLLGVAKADGEITSNQKSHLLGVFEEEFQISREQASDLLLAASHLIRNEIYLVDGLAHILERTASKFTPKLVSTLLKMMRESAAQDGPIGVEQTKLIEATERYFAARSKSSAAWN
jgi:uncharacterized tellurite resistance protein B-like protein